MEANSSKPVNTQEDRGSSFITKDGQDEISERNHKESTKDTEESYVVSIANDLRILIQSQEKNEIVGRFLSPEVVQIIRKSLISSSPVILKHGVFILKSIISYVLNFDADVDVNTNQLMSIMLHNGRHAFKLFWSDFFDLFEILNEKQFHIIQPFLAKLNSLSFKSEESACWLMILVDKMLSHDNRALAKEGLYIFLNYGLSLSLQDAQKSRKDEIDFIRNSLFPVIKDRVGWILAEPKDLIECAENLGKLIRLLHCNNQETSTCSALKLILHSDTDMGPVVTYFLVLAAYNQLSDEKFTSTHKESTGIFPGFSVEAISQFESFLDEVNYCMLFRLTAADKFLKTKIQHLFINMVAKQLGHYELKGIVCRSKFNAHHTEDTKLSFHLKMFEFLGALDSNTFCYSTEKLTDFIRPEFVDGVVLENQHTWMADENKRTVEHFLLSQINYSPLRIKGFLRWLLLHKLLFRTSVDSLSKLSKEFASLVSDILEKKFKDELLTATKEEFETILDFLQCLVTIQKLQDESDKDTIEMILSLSSRGLVDCIYELLEEKINEAVFLNKTLKVLPIFKYAISEAKLSSDVDFLTKLQPIMSRFSELPSISQILVLNLILLMDETCAKLCSPVVREQLINSSKNLLISDEIETLNLTDDSSTKNEIVRKFSNLKLAVLVELCKQNEIHPTRFQSKQEVKKLLDTGFNLMETGADSSFAQGILICKIAADLAFHHEYEEILIEVATTGIDKAWKGVKELHKSEYFWDTCSSFISMIASPSFCSKNILSAYSANIFELSGNVSGLPLLLAEELSLAKLRALSNVEKKYSSYLKELVGVNIKASCFGSAIPKSMKLTFNLWEYMCANDTPESSALSGNYERKISLPFNGNAKSRIISLLNIMSLLEVANEDGKTGCFFAEIVKNLLNINEGDADGVDKRRYFVGSQVHRVKQRVVQILLVLQPYFDRDLSEEVMKTLLVSLGNDGPQASVRYLTEWIIINILLKYPKLHGLFFRLSSECCLTRPGFGALFATIALHTSTNLLKSSTCTEKFIDEALQNVTALLMSQNFTVRIYGNISFCKIFERAVSCNLVSVIPKFQVIYTCAKQTVATAAGNFRKIYDNILNDFYVKIFSPVDHYFYDVIFIHLPRLSRMCSDEIIHEVDLKDISMNFKSIINLNLPYLSPLKVQAVYKDNSEYSWHLKTTLIDGREQGEEIAETGVPIVDNQLGNVLQVKGNPWKYLPVADEIQDFPQEIQLKKKSREDGLVVVASLIDRIPNLGGLCRTCEVFGASKYVISSLKHLDDQQFKSLSVSAHRWVDILEVPVQDLKLLLTSYSAKGYTIVGVEQALESSKLNNFIFPKKSLLLLGNEKYGIPTDLLSLCDNCVEIPQVGLIRSLNVHVTGALCIWQYASQHII